MRPRQSKKDRRELQCETAPTCPVPAKAESIGDPTNGAVGAPSFSRWAAFEKAVLSKLNEPRECLRVIAQRQQQIDDDSNEADLVAAYIRKRLTDHNLDPDTCHVYMTTAEITDWLREAIGTKLPVNKATPFLRALAIVELRYTKRNGAPGWAWRGRNSKDTKGASVLSRLGIIPR